MHLFYGTYYGYWQQMQQPYDLDYLLVRLIADPDFDIIVQAIHQYTEDNHNNGDTTDTMMDVLSLIIM